MYQLLIIENLKYVGKYFIVYGYVKMLIPNFWNAAGI